MNKIFKEHIDSLLLNFEYTKKYISLTLQVSEFFNNINLDDVSSVSILENYYNNIPTIHLHMNKKDSKLVHELTQKFEMKFEKYPEYNNEGIVYRGDVNKEGVKKLEIFIHGIMPERCRVEYEEIPLSEYEIKKTKKVAKVICND